MSGSCLVQLAALVVSFNGPESTANFTNASISGDLSSLLLQFKTSQANSRIMRMNRGRQMFSVDIRGGFLQVVYNLNDTGNGTKEIRSRRVNTSEWFLVNISSKPSYTHIGLANISQVTSSPCTFKESAALNIRLLGDSFSALFRTAGMIIGGKTNNQTLEPFKGCIGNVMLGSYPLRFLNQSQNEGPSYFTRHFSGVSEDCSCSSNFCRNGTNIWDRAVGRCDCKCRQGYEGEACEIEITSEDDGVEAEFIYLVVGITVGVLLLLTCVICAIVYCKRTNSSAFGVYNPQGQEKAQGQQLSVVIKVPPPEKLI